MGAFIVNINVRSENRQAVERGLKELGSQAAWVTDAKNGWITVYDEEASTQDDRRIRELSTGLSSALNAPVIAFLVHDSDFVCYWLIEDGELVDGFNSRPGYFDDDESEEEVPCRPELLIKYCVPGTQIGDVRSVLLDKEEIFAEENLRKLSELLGIEPDRATTDFESLKRGEDPTEIHATFVGEGQPPSPNLRILRRPLPGSGDDEDDEDDFDETPGPRIRTTDAAASLAKMFGWGGQQAPADPQVEQLVQAAAENNVAEIERLVAAGVNVDAQAAMKATSLSLPTAARMLGGKLPFPVTPLMAALASKQTDATRRLLELGASVKTLHPMFGTPVHAAASGGQPGLLRLVIEAGGDVNGLNAQKQTPLQNLRYFRTMTSQIANLGPLGAALGRNLQAELEKIMPTPEALNECEQILIAHGGR